MEPQVQIFHPIMVTPENYIDGIIPLNREDFLTVLNNAILHGFSGKLLGSGANGTVAKFVLHLPFGNIFLIVKRPNSELIAETVKIEFDNHKRFLTLPGINRSVYQEFFVPAFAFGTSAEGNFVFYPDFGGSSLQNEINKFSIEGRRISYDAALTYLRNMYIAVGVLHLLGGLHLDLKPDNIILTPDNRIKLIDFGLVFPRGGVGIPGIGTPGYIHPAQMNTISRGIREYRFNISNDEYSLEKIIEDIAGITAIPPGAVLHPSVIDLATVNQVTGLEFARLFSPSMPQPAPMPLMAPPPDYPMVPPSMAHVPDEPMAESTAPHPSALLHTGVVENTNMSTSFGGRKNKRRRSKQKTERRRRRQRKTRRRR
jgi:serine/threonine protein kinase